jgi:hypothetical protein
MIAQYPHYLFVHVVGASVQDADGNWTTTNDSYQFLSMCREETNGKGSVINGSDGRSVVYSSVIYIPRSGSSVAEGAEVVVTQFNDPEDGVRLRGRVLKFDVGQMNKRLWV